MLLLPQQLSAEVYFCDGAWRSTPCDASSKPVEDLPPISNVDLGRELPVVTSEPNERVSRPIRQLERTFSCRRVSQGAMLDLRELEIVMTLQGVPALQGIIVNESINPAISTIGLGISATGSRDETVVEVSQPISGKQRTTFSVPLTPELTKAVSLQVKLYYEPAGRCPLERIRVPRSRTHHSGGPSLASEKAIWQEIKKDLDDVNDRIIAFRRKRTTEVDFRNKAFVTAYSRLDQAYLRLCSVQQKREVGQYSSRFTTACTRTRNLLRDLYVRAQ